MRSGIVQYIYRCEPYMTQANGIFFFLECALWIANLCHIYFDALDLSECRSEEVISFF